MTIPTEIVVTRTALFNGTGTRRPFSWLYECEDANGRQFHNTSIVELRRVLKRAHGRCLVITENWDHSITNPYKYANSTKAVQTPR